MARELGEVMPDDELEMLLVEASKTRSNVIDYQDFAKVMEKSKMF